MWPPKGTGKARLQARLSRWWYGHNVQKPTVAELEEAHHHVEEEDAHDAPLVGHAADGHQFDGRHDVVEGDDLAHRPGLTLGGWLDTTVPW